MTCQILCTCVVVCCSWFSERKVCNYADALRIHKYITANTTKHKSDKLITNNDCVIVFVVILVVAVLIFGVVSAIVVGCSCWLVWLLRISLLSFVGCYFLAVMVVICRLSWLLFIIGCYCCCFR